MIYVSQGHERGVGLEIFLKSFLCLSKNSQKNFILVVCKNDLKENFNIFNFNFSFNDKGVLFEGSQLNCSFLDELSIPHSTLSLDYILKNISKEDVLLTLPTSKDQLIDENGNNLNGHTEYFRHFYKNKNIPMTFISPDMNVLLLTDHIDINDISSDITKDLTIEKTETVLSNFPRSIDTVIFSGLNPHAGEGGLISSDDNVISESIEVLKSKYPKIHFSGPFPADTIHFQGFTKNKLFIYASHDQGLGPFKLVNGLTGINVTFGLPFLRVSVDHGTAFNLYGKNCASYQGMLYLLTEISTWS